MAPKSMIRKVVGRSCRLIQMHVVVLVLIGLLILQGNGLAVNAQGANAGQLFLDQKESQVKQLAAAAAMNDRNSCGELKLLAVLVALLSALQVHSSFWCALL